MAEREPRERKGNREGERESRERRNNRHGSRRDRDGREAREGKRLKRVPGSKSSRYYRKGILDGSKVKKPESGLMSFSAMDIRSFRMKMGSVLEWMQCCYLDLPV